MDFTPGTPQRSTARAGPDVCNPSSGRGGESWAVAPTAGGACEQQPSLAASPSQARTRADPWGPVKRKGYSMGSVLGSGAFAEVRLAKKPRTASGIHDLPLGEMVALKRIVKQHKPGHRHTGVADPALQEYIIMKSLKHPLVVTVGDMVDARDALYMELEYADGGDLFKAISPAAQGLDENVARVYMKDVCEGLAFIHSKRIVHSDIKPENILLAGGRAKLADFGLAAHMGAQRAHPAVGTAPYMAPELVQCGGPRYVVQPAHDIWGFAIILYAVFFADLPWESALHDDADYAKFSKHRATLNLYPFPLLSKPLKALFQQMLSDNPDHRPTAEELVVFFSKGRAWFRNDKDSNEDLGDWLRMKTQASAPESTIDMVCQMLASGPLSSLVKAVSSSATAKPAVMPPPVPAAPPASRPAVTIATATAPVVTMATPPDHHPYPPAHETTPTIKPPPAPVPPTDEHASVPRSAPQPVPHAVQHPPVSGKPLVSCTSRHDDWTPIDYISNAFGLFQQ
eukprot:m.206599 g.206599  ORF g.206599 m.206599 type:complete len:512 (-) comp23415_c0_seq1:72-1607(-)